MRKLTRAVITMAAIAGAMTATGAATASAAPAAPASGEVSTQAVDWYYGTGYGSTQFSAIRSAEWDAQSWARLGGYSPFIDCSVTSQRAYQISTNYYRGHVTLFCSSF